MRFESKKQKEELILGFEEHAKELQKIKEENPKRDKNYNCKVVMDYRCEYDTLDEVSGECSGDIYVFYIHQPKILDAVKILGSKSNVENFYNPLLLAWDAMVDPKESSPEVFTDRIKLGYLSKMLGHIDALMGDQKKS